MDEEAAVWSVKKRCDLRKLAQLPEGRVEVAHENFTPARLDRLVEFKGRLDVGVGGEKENKLTHLRESGRGRVP